MCQLHVHDAPRHRIFVHCLLFDREREKMRSTLLLPVVVFGEWGYELMRREMAEYCDDTFLIDSSLQTTESECLEQCATTGDPESLRPRGPFNYALYDATEGVCYCQSTCLFRHIPNCDARDTVKGTWSYWRHETRWDTETKEFDQTWALDLNADLERILAASKADLKRDEL